MAWNKDLPAGNKNIALGDDDIRSNNDTLETAIDLEHDFTTAGGQTGRHHFGVHASQVAIDAITSGVVAGSVAFRSDVRGNYVWYYWDGAAWEYVDCGAPNLPRIDEQSEFETCQFSVMEALAGAEITTGPPNVLHIDLMASAFRSYTMTGATEFNSFTNDVSGASTTLTIQLTQPTPAVAVTFASGIFQSPYGIAPIIGTGDAEKTILQFVKQTNGKFLVLTSPVIEDI